MYPMDVYFEHVYDVIGCYRFSTFLLVLGKSYKRQFCGKIKFENNFEHFVDRC